MITLGQTGAQHLGTARRHFHIWGSIISRDRNDIIITRCDSFAYVRIYFEVVSFKSNSRKQKFARNSDLGSFSGMCFSFPLGFGATTTKRCLFHFCFLCKHLIEFPHFSFYDRNDSKEHFMVIPTLFFLECGATRKPSQVCVSSYVWLGCA